MSYLAATIHLNNGNTVKVTFKDKGDPDEVADNLRRHLTGLPHWDALGNFAFFTGAIAGIEVDTTH